MQYKDEFLMEISRRINEIKKEITHLESQIEKLNPPLTSKEHNLLQAKQESLERLKFNLRDNLVIEEVREYSRVFITKQTRKQMGLLQDLIGADAKSISSMAICYLAAYQKTATPEEFESLMNQPCPEENIIIEYTSKWDDDGAKFIDESKEAIALGEIEWDVVFESKEIQSLGEMGLLEPNPYITRRMDCGASQAIAAGIQLLFDKLQQSTEK